MQGDLLAELRSSGVVTQLAWTERGTLVEVRACAQCCPQQLVPALLTYCTSPCFHVHRLGCRQPSRAESSSMLWKKRIFWIFWTPQALWRGLAQAPTSTCKEFLLILAQNITAETGEIHTLSNTKPCPEQVLLNLNDHAYALRAALPENKSRSGCEVLRALQEAEPHARPCREVSPSAYGPHIKFRHSSSNRRTIANTHKAACLRNCAIVSENMQAQVRKGGTLSPDRRRSRSMATTRAACRTRDRHRC